MKLLDTICALSTPVGTGGISVIRVSGPSAFDITDKIFKSKSRKTVSDMNTHTVCLGDIFDSEGYRIDEVLATKFIGPHSFTGENVVEISCHGGIAVVKLILKELIKNGFEIIGVYGDLDGTPASDEDMRHIYVARNVLPRKRYEAPME
jgi:tRNA modification GTPase